MEKFTLEMPSYRKNASSRQEYRFDIARQTRVLQKKRARVHHDRFAMTSLGRESGDDAIFDPNIYSALESNASRDSGTSRMKYGKYVSPILSRACTRHAAITATELAGLNEITR